MLPLASLAGLACVACCVPPLLLAAGAVGGIGWAAAVRWLPGIAVGLVAAAVAVCGGGRNANRPAPVAENPVQATAGTADLEDGWAIRAQARVPHAWFVAEVVDEGPTL